MVGSDRSRKNDVYLAFVDTDRKTSELLSKIMLLSHDDTIEDETILAQLHAND